MDEIQEAEVEEEGSEQDHPNNSTMVSAPILGSGRRRDESNGTEGIGSRSCKLGIIIVNLDNRDPNHSTSEIEMNRTDFMAESNLDTTGRGGVSSQRADLLHESRHLPDQLDTNSPSHDDQPSIDKGQNKNHQEPKKLQDFQKTLQNLIKKGSTKSKSTTIKIPKTKGALHSSGELDLETHGRSPPPGQRAGNITIEKIHYLASGDKDSSGRGHLTSSLLSSSNKDVKRNTPETVKKGASTTSKQIAQLLARADPKRDTSKTKKPANNSRSREADASN